MLPVLLCEIQKKVSWGRILLSEGKNVFSHYIAVNIPTERRNEDKSCPIIGTKRNETKRNKESHVTSKAGERDIPLNVSARVHCQEILRGNCDSAMD